MRYTDDTYHVRKGQGKHGRSRDIPLNPQGREALQNWLKDAEERGIKTGYLVVDHRKGENMQKVSKSIENWVYRNRSMLSIGDSTWAA